MLHDRKGRSWSIPKRLDEVPNAALHVRGTGIVPISSIWHVRLLSSAIM